MKSRTKPNHNNNVNRETQQRRLGLRSKGEALALPRSRGARASACASEPPPAPAGRPEPGLRRAGAALGCPPGRRPLREARDADARSDSPRAAAGSGPAPFSKVSLSVGPGVSVRPTLKPGPLGNLPGTRAEVVRNSPKGLATPPDGRPETVQQPLPGVRGEPQAHPARGRARGSYGASPSLRVRATGKAALASACSECPPGPTELPRIAMMIVKMIQGIHVIFKCLCQASLTHMWCLSTHVFPHFILTAASHHYP